MYNALYIFFYCSYKFYVLNDAYMVHYPHEKSVSYNWAKDPKFSRSVGILSFLPVSAICDSSRGCAARLLDILQHRVLYENLSPSTLVCCRCGKYFFNTIEQKLMEQYIGKQASHQEHVTQAAAVGVQ